MAARADRLKKRGEVPERLKGPVLKTGVALVVTGGSNPPLSAMFARRGAVFSPFPRFLGPFAVHRRGEIRQPRQRRYKTLNAASRPAPIPGFCAIDVSPCATSSSLSWLS